IGSDSHVSIDVAEELRWLEYGQRLRARRRAIAPSPEALFVEAARAGARALGQTAGVIAAGQRADLIVLDADAPMFAGGDIASAVDRFVVCGGPRPIRDVYVGGERVVAGGCHVAAEAVAARYRAALAE
ncbi:MAG: amidohydrolase family protein, partial [Candidatus Velthaea sp.]